MEWEFSDQAAEEFKRAMGSSRSPTAKAYAAILDRLEKRPDAEGIVLRPSARQTDPFLQRVIEAIGDLRLPSKQRARVSYQTIKGHRRPPPTFAFAVHVPNWSRDAHLLLTLGRIGKL